MLKLVKLYSNKENIFPKIAFQDGLNIVYANIFEPASITKTSHSLGKSTLAKLIDYMLIKEINKYAFPRHKKHFIDFIFYLEVQTDINLFVTITRAVSGKVSLHTSKESSNIIANNNAFSEIGVNLGIAESKKKLGEILKLNIVYNTEEDYRKGLMYCIRHQEEYNNIFKSKEYIKRDRYWKPYLSGLLGINSDLIRGKFNAMDRMSALKTAIKELKNIGVSAKSKGELEANINNLRNKTLEMERELSTISFQKIDENITYELVEDIGMSISKINQKIYTFETKIYNINESLKEEFNYDISNIQAIFKSIKVNIPEHLTKTYDELIELNLNMGKDRHIHLNNAKESLSSSLGKAIQEKASLSKKQEELSQLLLDKEAFQKFQNLQKILIKDKSRLATLEEKLIQLDTTTTLKTQLIEVEADERRIGVKVEELCAQSVNETLKKVNVIFSSLVKKSIGINVSFYVASNTHGNIVFDTATDDNTDKSKGHSYNKTLAICFDIALLVFYSSDEYYRFSYHDGMFESLDDRVKSRLVKELRVLAEKHGLQFIITMLDSDMPKEINFTQDEMIKELSDKGKEGRLFRMDMF